MGSSHGWFLLMSLLAAGGFVAGYRVGNRHDVWRGRVWMLAAVFLLLVWCWLHRHPSVALQIIPPSSMRYLEGIGAAPIAMFLLGIAWTRSSLPRQRRLVLTALAVSLLYFVRGGAWMLQTTPAAAMGQQVSVGMVLQSQDYSCVPAACATALNRLGVPTTEARMASLTETRPGQGATLIRALDGLQRELRGTDIEATLVQVHVDDLKNMPMPLLTSLKVNQTRRHMVVILHADKRGASVADPSEGMLWLDRDVLERLFDSQIIVFQRNNRTTSPTKVAAR